MKRAWSYCKAWFWGALFMLLVGCAAWAAIMLIVCLAVLIITLLGGVVDLPFTVGAMAAAKVAVGSTVCASCLAIGASFEARRGD